MSKTTQPSPWTAGWRAAKANLLPGSIVQAVMVGLLIAYFTHEPTRSLLSHIANIKAHWGFAFSALSAIIAGAFIPELLRLLVFQKGRPAKRNAANLAFTIPFWGSMGIIVDLLYRGQAIWFGDEATPAVVIPQVIVDQFIYNPLIAQPVTVWLYDWRQRGWRFHPQSLTWNYYKTRVFPVLITGWAIWIPVVIVLYTLPQTLQIPLFALALALWVLIFTWMSEEATSSST